MSGIHIDIRDGVKGEAVSPKVLPYPAEKVDTGDHNVGSWRAHLNTLSEYEMSVNIRVRIRTDN